MLFSSSRKSAPSAEGSGAAPGARILLKPDLCVVGVDPAALELALEVAARGGAVAIAGLERGYIARPRAEALRAGLLAAAAGMRAPAAFEPAVLAARLAAANALPVTPERLAAAGVAVLPGPCSFVDPRTLVSDEAAIRAGIVVLAPLPAPRPPALPGLEDVAWTGIEEAVLLHGRPGPSAIIGSDRGAVELAQAWAWLGFRPALISPGPLLPGHDREMVALLAARLRRDGVDIRQADGIARLEPRSRGAIRITLAGGSGRAFLDVRRLVLSCDGAADLDGLALDRARIRREGAAVAADARMRSSNRRVFVLGAAAGKGADEAASRIHAMLIRKSLGLAGGAPPVSTAWLPRVVLTEPALAEIGAGEAASGEAAALPGPDRPTIVRMPCAESEMARLIGARPGGAAEGHLKLVVDAAGRVRGVAMLGAGAAEAIDFWSFALARGHGLAEIAAHPFAAPLAGEIGKRAALAYLGEQARPSFGGRLRRLLNRQAFPR